MQSNGIKVKCTLWQGPSKVIYYPYNFGAVLDSQSRLTSKYNAGYNGKNTFEFHSYTIKHVPHYDFNWNQMLFKFR